jgi:putative intracellular protease/amidase
MTCHPSVADVVGAHGVLTEGRVVDTPGLITSQGPGTAFEFALVARLVDAEAAASLPGPMILGAPFSSSRG